MKVVTNMARHFTNTDNPIDFPKLENKMNERIKLLAEQAELNATLLFNKDKLERFAELIVQECASVAAKNQAEDMDWDIAEIIKEHFGVEE